MAARRTSVTWAVVAAALALSPGAFAEGPPPRAQVQASQAAQAALPSLAPLIESVKGAVVNVDVQARSSRADGPGDLEDLLDSWRRSPNLRGEQLRQGKGSGVIIDSRGLVLTNNHVVEDAVLIRVTLDDGRSFDADPVGRDPATDVALVRIRGKVDNLPSARLGDSDQLRVGDWVFAIGNPFGLSSSVSLGIISAKARNINVGQYDEFLQTDAAINPGNSGGPLFNLRAEVVGINTAIAGNGSGIGFAVPSNLAKALLPQLEKEGVVTRGWLGIGIQSLSPELAAAMGVPAPEGAIVLSVNDGTPAKRAGLQRDDVIVSIDGAKVASSDALTRMVALKRPGSVSTLGFFRAGKRQEAKVTLGTRPDARAPARPASSGERPQDENNKQRVGLTLQDLDAQFSAEAGLPAEGALITEVVPGSAADRADLERGMIIVEADRKPVRSSADVTRLLRSKKPGDVLLIRVALPGSQTVYVRALTIP
jgi:serine protease Do